MKAYRFIPIRPYHGLYVKQTHLWCCCEFSQGVDLEDLCAWAVTRDGVRRDPTFIGRRALKARLPLSRFTLFPSTTHPLTIIDRNALKVQKMAKILYTDLQWLGSIIKSQDHPSTATISPPTSEHRFSNIKPAAQALLSVSIARPQNKQHTFPIVFHYLFPEKDAAWPWPRPGGSHSVASPRPAWYSHGHAAVSVSSCSCPEMDGRTIRGQE